MHFFSFDQEKRKNGVEEIFKKMLAKSFHSWWLGNQREQNNQRKIYIGTW